MYVRIRIPYVCVYTRRRVQHVCARVHAPLCARAFTSEIDRAPDNVSKTNIDSSVIIIIIISSISIINHRR